MADTNGATARPRRLPATGARPRKARRALKRAVLVACACLLALTAQLAGPSPATAADRGTPEEAIAMVKRVKASVKAKGLKSTLAAITKQEPAFKDRDLYAFVITFDGVLVAHGVLPILVGKYVLDLRDMDNTPFIRGFLEVAKSGRPGWVEYKWPNPSKNTIAQKSTHIEKLGNDYFVGVGVYKGELSR